MSHHTHKSVWPLVVIASLAVWAVSLTVAHFAFPNTHTVTVTKRVVVDPYAKAIFVGEDTFEIKEGWNQYCALYESHHGVAAGEVEPAEGQYVMQRCEARKVGPKG